MNTDSEQRHEAVPLSVAYRAGFSALPLYACYVLFPLSFMVFDFLNLSFFRNWIDVLWILLGYLSVIVMISHRVQVSSVMIFYMALATFGAALCIIGFVFGLAPVPIFVMEIKPVFYLLIALLFILTFGGVSSELYCRVGSWLALILIGEVAITFLASGLIQRPIGSGEVNYDAALICLSLVFALGSKTLSRKYTLVLFIGLIASLSRTGLLAACVILLFSKVVPLTIRILMVGAALSAVVLSFIVRGLDLGALEGLDRYWMWYSAVLYIANDPIGTSFSWLPGSALDVIVPDPVAALWENQQQNLNIDGIFPFHFHSMWLRLTLSWGWLPVLILLSTMLYVFVFRSRQYVESRGFIGILVVLGLTMGVVYNGNVALPFLLAALQIFSRGAGRVRRLADNVPRMHKQGSLGGL